MAIERLHLGTPEWEAYYANHLHRYCYAADFVREHKFRKVLDVACGVGYGAQWIATHSDAEVVAVDRDTDALLEAKQTFAHPKVQFTQDDCRELHEVGADAQFDAVVSFETIEHLSDPECFLERCAALLRPGGWLMLSSPNAPASSWEGKSDWVYHEREFTAVELEELLAAHAFTEFAFSGQRLTALGRLRMDIRGELNQLRSTPFVRLGFWLQRKLGRLAKLGPALPGRLDDFEIVPY